MPRPDQVCVGIVVGVHGVRGVVRIKSFTADPRDVAAYGEVADENGAQRFKVKVEGAARGAVLARLSGVGDRNAAEALKGLRLYVPRAALPATKEDEYYHADLIGLPVETREGARLGTVSAVHNFGAGDILELRGEDGRELMLPFSDAVVPEIDLAAGRIVAAPPQSLLEERKSPDRTSARRHHDRDGGERGRGSGGAGL